MIRLHDGQFRSQPAVKKAKEKSPSTKRETSSCLQRQTDKTGGSWWNLYWPYL